MLCSGFSYHLSSSGTSDTLKLGKKVLVFWFLLPAFAWEVPECNFLEAERSLWGSAAIPLLCF